MEEPCGIVLIGASLPRKVVAWERTQGAVVEATQGFTLIELSIVLVIIGLIVGGVLVGQDLIKAAQTRAQIAQIEKFNAAVNAFRNKYNGIPGDLALASANQFGFGSPTYFAGTQGERDGNGLIDGYGAPQQYAALMGENQVFWTDLSTSGFIDAGIPFFNPVYAGSVAAYATNMSSYLPAAKIGNGHYLHVFEDGIHNWFMLAQITGFSGATSVVYANAVIPPAQAYAIDVKVDDGLPTTGRVQAIWVNGSQTHYSQAPNAASDSASTCYHTTAPVGYSTGYQAGTNPTCAISFQFQ